MTGDNSLPNRPVREFTFRVEATDIPATGRTYSLSASESERAGLAKRFSLIGISALNASLFVKPVGVGPTIRVDGRVTASVVQRCIVTLEPVPAEIDDRVSAEFAPEEGGSDIELTLADDDPVEAFEDGAIDLGELAAQYLSLALDSYPRAGEATINPETLGRNVTLNAPNNPFGALVQIKRDV